MKDVLSINMKLPIFIYVHIYTIQHNSFMVFTKKFIRNQKQQQQQMSFKHTHLLWPFGKDEKNGKQEIKKR